MVSRKTILPPKQIKCYYQGMEEKDSDEELKSYPYAEAEVQVAQNMSVVSKSNGKACTDSSKHGTYEPTEPHCEFCI